VQTIIQAARQLRDEPIEWLLIGRGQDAARIRAMLDDVPLPRLQWLDWIDYEQLPATIHDADVCLGIFGMSDKAASVIPNKAFQALAAGRPVVSLDSPAMRELLGAPQDVARLVPAGDATALANVLRDLQRASILPPTPLAAFDAHAVGAQLLACLNAVDRVTGDAAQASRSGRGA
jgi:glycosyltransferase involved in cell wall biosynthesis